MLLNCSIGEDSDSKEIKTVNPKENPSWIFTGRTDAEAEVPILWPHDVTNQLIRKNPNVGNNWRQEEKMTEEMVGWHHQLNGPESEQALGDGEGHESLACCSPWGCKESDMTEQLNYCIETWSSLNGMWQAGWEGSLGENGSIYMYYWVPSLFIWNSQHH